MLLNQPLCLLKLRKCTNRSEGDAAKHCVLPLTFDGILREIYGADLTKARSASTLKKGEQN